MLTKTEHKHCLQLGCDFDCADEATLMEHHKNDHFQCPGCKIILASQTKLHKHTETCSSILHCPQCNVACAGKTRLAIHMERCFYCKECDFQTTHEGNYNIVCTDISFCGNSYSQW